MPRYYFQNDWFLFSVSCSSHLLPPASQVAAVAWSRRLEAHGMLCSEQALGPSAGVPGLQASSKNTPGELQRSWGQREGKGNWVMGQLLFWDCPEELGEMCWPLTRPILPFSCCPNKLVVWWIHHHTHGYSLCRTYCLHKCQLFGSWKKCGQAPLEGAVWSRADASSPCHSIFRVICDFLHFCRALALPRLKKKINLLWPRWAHRKE